MSTVLRRQFGVWPALAMIVTEVIGVGIFLTPTGMARTLGTTGWVLGVWALVGLMSIGGALCYAELATRFPEAGGGYVFLREAFGERCAFVYGWMSLLVMDPGLTAALGVGLAKYLLVLVGGSPSLVPAMAVASIVGISAVSLLGVESSARLLRWTAAAKLLAIAALVLPALVRSPAGDHPAVAAAAVSTPTVSILAGALMGAFFAFGGWWDLGKMSEEIVEPRRTLPTALIGGIALVTLVYAGVSVAFLHVMQRSNPVTDEAFVASLGAALFGRGADRLLAGAVVAAVGGSLAAVLLGAPRVYLAMARSGVFPARLVHFNARRQAAPLATLVQVALACVLVMLGSFDQILGYFVPAAVFFLGLSAAAILILPRPTVDSAVFRAPWHPLPIIVFLVLVVVMVALFAMGRPVQTLMGAAVIAIGIPVSGLRRVAAKSNDSEPRGVEKQPSGTA